jgi:hypothetical protein
MRAQRRMDVCVEQNYYEHIKGASSSSVGGTQLLTVGHKQHLVVKNKQYVKVDDDAHWLYMGDVNFGISKSLKLAATSAIEMTGGNVHIEASQKLVLQCGSSIIRLSPGGIEIEGPLVRINCGAAPAAGSSPNVVAAKEAGGSKCAEGKDKAPEPKKKPVPPPPKDERKKVPPPPDEERKKVPPPPDDNPKKFPPVIIVPIPAQVLCVSLHEIVEFGDAALAEIDALIEELDDATSEVLDQAENLSQDAVQRCADKVTAAQATMHDAKKEIANAQKAACEQLSTAGAQAQKLTQNVNNGVNTVQ